MGDALDQGPHPQPLSLRGEGSQADDLDREESLFGVWHEECGVFGIWNHHDAANVTHIALYALQHRGQESAGIAVVDGEGMHHHRGMGLVSEVFTARELAALPGTAAAGHVRYSTTGSSRLANAQPLVFAFRQGNLAIAHNGNFINAERLHDDLERQGSIFQSTSDTEVVAHLIARAGGTSGAERDYIASVRESMRAVEGGYAMVLLSNDHLIALRDPNGLRPMALGRLGGAYVVASETCAFDTIGATFVRDVDPGELLVIDDAGVRSERFANAPKKALCTFEYIYFARPDSDIDGINVHAVRKRLGRVLARAQPVDADVVIGVPDSSISAAIGYAEESGIPYEIGLIKNRYIGRTFIQPSQELRQRGVSLKLNVVRRVVEGKRVVLVDDSIVRGITSARLVELVRAAGAAEVHLRISSPPVAHPCFYGIDTSDRTKLVAAMRSVPQIQTLIGADSLAYLTEAELLSAFGETDLEHHPFCNACFTGCYPTRLYTTPSKDVLEPPRCKEVLEPAQSKDVPEPARKLVAP
ncbi:MAG TPA: amidophosphoribosyltransferase [Ktedonobacterales bacterium]|jgi:amidophosphoribosyltransferase